MSTTLARPSTGKVKCVGAGERVLFSVFLVGAALLLGVSVGTNHWLFAVMLLALPLVLQWPVRVSLGLFALLLPFDAISVLGQGKSGTTLTFVVGGAATLVLMFTALAGNRFTAPPRAALWWSLFVIWSVSTAFWALNAELSWQRVPTALALLLMFLVTVSVRITPGELSCVELCAIVGGFAAAVYSTAQFYSGIFYRGALSMRASMIAGGREEDPNQFAVVLLLPIALALGRLFSTHNRLERTLLTIVTGVIGLGVFLTMSRGVIFALSVLVLFFVYRLRVGWRALIPVCTLLSLCLVVPESFFARLRGAVSSRAAGRFDIWIAGIQAIWHHGLWGAGLDNFSTTYSEVAGAAPTFSGFARDSHNIYIGMLVELGIIGFLFFACALRSQLRDAAQVSGSMHGIGQYRLLSYQAACYGMLAAGISLDIVWRKSFWLCWMLLAVTTSFSRRQARS